MFSVCVCGDQIKNKTSKKGYSWIQVTLVTIFLKDFDTLDKTVACYLALFWFQNEAMKAFSGDKDRDWHSGPCSCCSDCRTSRSPDSQSGRHINSFKSCKKVQRVTVFNVYLITISLLSLHEM